MFLTINLHFVTSNQISAYRKLNLPLTSSIYLAFLNPERQRKLKQTKVYHAFFLLCRKRNNPQTFQNDTCKNPFLQCVCYWYNFLQRMFFILCDSWKILLFIKVYRDSETVFTIMLLLSLKPLFWKKLAFYALFPQ